MNLHDFYYDLPQELIAQDPLEDRSSSRLMVLNKNTGKIQHHIFKDIVKYLHKGDCLVINNTKVIPARLFGSKVGTDAKIEVLLLKRKENDVWETLVKPGKKCKVGTEISFGEGLLVGKVIDVVEEGNRLIQFKYEGIFEEILDKLGQMPLPPYITHQLKDKNRYQTVYAKYEGSAAAPTAGLHFTKELLNEIKEKGVEIANVTLHVGLGTFRPQRALCPALDRKIRRHADVHMVRPPTLRRGPRLRARKRRDRRKTRERRPRPARHSQCRHPHEPHGERRHEVPREYRHAAAARR